MPLYATILFPSHLKFGNSRRYFQKKDSELAGKLASALPNDVKIARTSDPALASCLLPDTWRMEHGGCYQPTRSWTTSTNTQALCLEIRGCIVLIIIIIIIIILLFLSLSLTNNRIKWSKYWTCTVFWLNCNTVGAVSKVSMEVGHQSNDHYNVSISWAYRVIGRERMQIHQWENKCWESFCGLLINMSKINEWIWMNETVV